MSIFKALKFVTSGGQTFLHNIRMFEQVTAKILIATILSFLLSLTLGFYINTEAYQRYIMKQWIKAEALLIMEHRSKQIVEMPSGESYPVYSAEIVKAPMVVDYLNQIREAAFTIIVESLVMTFALFVLMIRWLKKRGEKQNEAKVIRGNELVPEKELKKCIKKAGKVSPYSIGKIYLPYGSETQHIQIVGTTGAGKTVAIRQLLKTIRERNERAIIYDKGGIYLSRFYEEERDIILNPLDKRGSSWTVWEECEDKADLEALAEALMPMPINNTMDPFWINAARMIFVSTAHELRNHPKRSNLMLLQYLLTADLGKIYNLLRHTESESLVSEKVQKTALNVKTVMATYLKSLLYLKDEGEPFSIRNWIINDKSNSCLFVSSDGRKHPTIRPLITAWINTATKELLSLPPNDNRRIWFILDEIATLHNLPFLSAAKSEARKFGGCFLIGHHGASQLRTIYGNDGAKALANLCSTRLFLRQPEKDDAQHAAINVGSYEIEEVSETISYGASSMRDGVSVARQTKEKLLVLPTEVQGLNDLNGYLRLKGDLPATKIVLPYVHYPIIHEEFIGRALESDPLRQQVEELVDQFSDPLLANSHEEALEAATGTQKEVKPQKTKEKEPKDTVEFL